MCLLLIYHQMALTEQLDHNYRLNVKFAVFMSPRMLKDRMVSLKLLWFLGREFRFC